MNLSEAKLNAYNMAAIEDSICLVRQCSIKNKKDTIGYLVVNKNTTTTPKNADLIAVAFDAGLRENDHPKEICDITPKEYKDIVNKKRKLPKGWKLEEILFDGIFLFNDIDDLKLMMNQCSKFGRKWQIKYSKDYSFTNHENKLLFEHFINLKLPYEAL